MSSVLPNQPPEIAHACVVDNRRETPYRRAGHGEPVLLLVARDSTPTMELFGALAQRHRVYMPILPHPTSEAQPAFSDFADWLRGFLDGLGVARISIVTDEIIGAAAAEFALQEPFRVSAFHLIDEVRNKGVV